MKKIIAIIIFLWATTAVAQENLFIHFGMDQDRPTAKTVELGDYIYIIKAIQLVDSAYEMGGIYYLYKYNKYTYTLEDSVYIDGDTVQTDSIITQLISDYGLVTNGIDIHLFYKKRFEYDTITSFEKLYFTKVDTNLNFISNPKRLEVEGGFQSVAINNNNRILLVTMRFTRYSPTAWTTKGFYYLMDDTANILYFDSTGTGTTDFLQVENYNDNNFILTGRRIRPPNFEGSLCWYIIDNEGQKVDSNKLVLGDSAKFNENEPLVGPTIKYIPEKHNLIFGGFPVSHSPRSVIVKSEADSIHIATKKLVNYGIDSLDYEHDKGWNLENMKYNPFDGFYYFFDLTHRLGSWAGNGSYCDIMYGFLQLICFDEELNLQWKKLIRKEWPSTGCQHFSGMTVPDGRPGMIITGKTYEDGSNLSVGMDYWMYYITDTTEVDSTIYPEPTSIYPQQVVNNELQLYPNPANTTLHIEAKENIATIQVIDITGKIVLQEFALQDKKARINIAALPSGMYLLKAQLKDGSMVKEKFVKME